ncbi:MAG: NfeD family protein [Pseudomonadota bacterium]
MIAEFFKELGAWGWVLAALLFLGIEIMAPGFLFLWLGVGALLVGLIGLLDLFGDGWTNPYAPWVAFAVFSLVAALIGRNLYDPRKSPSDEPNLNNRAEQLVGRKGVLIEPISNGSGRARVGDTVWAVEGMDQPVGAQVVVTGHQAGTLQVEGMTA